ncbi:hypothetical protein ACI79C_18560 [Geodermatophilus sp. SYSU D00697]
MTLVHQQHPRLRACTGVHPGGGALLGSPVVVGGWSGTAMAVLARR